MTVQPADLWWMPFGACVGADPNLFFSKRGESCTEARAICATCQPGIRDECLAYALRNNEQFGIWGGTNERERRAMRKGARTIPAAPVRAWLESLVSQYGGRAQLSLHVSKRSSLGPRGIETFLADRKRQTVSAEWLRAVCEALDCPDMLSRFEVAA